MAIVAKKRRTEGRIITQVNLQKLLIPTEFHPKGRVQLDVETGMIKGPRNNVLYKTKKKIGGREIELPVNGGHAKNDGSVWRVALNGPARYFWKLLRDEMAYRLRGSRSISAPKLVDEELVEAREFVAYLLAKKAEQKDILPGDFLNAKYDHGMREDFEEINKGFYAWKKKQDKIELPTLQAVFQFLPV